MTFPKNIKSEPCSPEWQKKLLNFEKLEEQGKILVLEHLVICAECRENFNYLVFNQSKNMALVGELLRKIKTETL